MAREGQLRGIKHSWFGYWKYLSWPARKPGLPLSNPERGYVQPLTSRYPLCADRSLYERPASIEMTIVQGMLS